MVDTIRVVIEENPINLTFPGSQGVPGISAYGVAVKNGYVGTEEEWLLTLVWQPGTNGTNGTNGVNWLDWADGLSAYEIAVDEWFVGDVTAWLESLQGADGADGADGLDGTNGNNGETGPQWEKGLNRLWPRDGGTTYVIDDAISYDWSSYICILWHTNETPPNGTYWEVLASKGNDGADGNDWADGVDGVDWIGVDSFFTTTSVTTSATPTPTGETKFNEYYLTALAESATFGAPSWTPVNWNRLMIRIKDNNTARALAFNPIYRAVGITLPTTTVLWKTTYLLCIYNSADTKRDGVALAQQA